MQPQDIKALLLAQAPALTVSLYEPMAEHNTFRVGGKADVLVDITGVDQITAVQRVCKQYGIPLTIVGNGSNLLVRDGGVRGVVMAVGRGFAHVWVQGNCVCAQAGALMSAVAAQAQRAGLCGLEFAAGIPGSVGGAIYMNAGAYEHSVGEFVQTVAVADAEGALRQIGAQDMGFAYRSSAVARNGWVVTQACFALQNDGADCIRERMEQFNERRRASQPLEFPSAGSFFKRPNGYYAGALIEQAGLKGLRVGGAQVSPKHAGFIINAGGATAADVLALAAQVRQRVYEHSGVRLDLEVHVIGEDAVDD